MQRHWTITTIASRYFEDKTCTDPVTGQLRPTQSHSQPSRNESHRIYRALYHFELYCLLFVSDYILKSNRGQYGSKVTLQYTEARFSVTGFLPFLESWEIEEIACIKEYIMSYYGKMLQTFGLKIPRKEREARGLTASLGGTLLSSYLRLLGLESQKVNPKEMLKELELRKEYLMSCGLKIFALCQASNVEDQAAIIFARPWQRDKFLTNAILTYRNAERENSTRWDETYRIVIPFTSDNEGPNAALPWSRFLDLEYFYKGRDFLRSWGYIMWDLGREWKVLGQDPEI